MLEIDLTVLIDLSCSYFILIYSFEVVDKAKLMWFEEIFEEIKNIGQLKSKSLTFSD
ncbi:hypothetical protein AKJ00_05060 [Streptococcus pneumoniae]|nr:hypothetical protein AKI54_08830 [Streptococcus pneumoniae]KYA18648.1 hypothetical protein AKI64_03220 [Streptococcus pneumoniae]KYA43534.1 hypothetical protein AKI82_08365 [Streptococcus pneumoniae]KYA45800.1 hypothetical protein AKI83_09075 [Streptococcus pneumoniae]KYA68096.1 hypothetical protein AKJ00_05060 [Streptococcus pneumoniae]